MTKTLIEAFKSAEFPVNGHGKRNVKVLTDAFDTIDEHLESDMYGSGKVIEEFQEKMAKYLGKESAVFFPSGTMAQQIALRIWCDEKGIKKVAYHPLCHLEIHEQEGIKKLHQIESVLLAEKDRVIEMEDILNMEDEVSAVLLELPQREIGGQLPDYKTLEDISSYCKEKGIRLHLDGARLYEVLPYYQKTAAEVCSLFDSVYVSLYKGIGGIAGAILAGDESFTQEAKVWKTRHGGNLISLYPYILAADHYFEERVGKMEQYYIEAIEYASFFNACDKVETIPAVPVSNMFHVHFHVSKEKAEAILLEVAEETGVVFTGYLKEVNDHQCSYEATIGDLYHTVPKDRLMDAFWMMDEKLKAAGE
ncbi:threonine aldolase family protein [Falsibacillus pallidus]|uniref:threonine aldolase family protein n=1 Tax=Falsibacillus pallidus TaxID=493781 RepID=UPI003D9857D7